MVPVLGASVDYSVSVSTTNPFVSLIGLAFGIVVLAGMWKVFAKAGQPGWACLIPIYNTIVLLRVAGRPAWWFLLMFIPFVNFVVAIVALRGVARAFGKGVGFTVGLVLLSPIFFCILGFGSSRYQGGAQQWRAAA